MRIALLLSLSLLGLTACPDESTDAGGGGQGAAGADGGAGGDGGATTGGGGEAGGVPDTDATLFVVQDPQFSGNSGVASYSNPASLTGAASPATRLEGTAVPEAVLQRPRALALSSSNELYVSSSIYNDDILVYADAFGANDPETPSRLLHVADGGFELVSLALSENDETLYVVSHPTDIMGPLSSVLAFDSVSGLDGDVSPSRRLDFDSFSPTRIQMVGDDLYVAGRRTGFEADSIYLVEDARTADGVVSPSRFIHMPSSASFVSFHISDDRMFVVGANSLLLYDGISTFEGGPPSGATTIAGAFLLRAVVRDRTGMLFISDSGGDIYKVSEDDLVVGETTPSGMFSVDEQRFASVMLLHEAR